MANIGEWYGMYEVSSFANIPGIIYEILYH